MEPTYRRRQPVHPRQNKNKEQSQYKKGLMKNSVFCIALLTLCLICKNVDAPGFIPAQNAISYIIKTNTDFQDIGKKVQTFFTSFLSEDAKETDGREFLANLTLPVQAPVTSPFGLRTDPKTGNEAYHYGVDLGAPAGEKIVAPAEGTVTETGQTQDYGNYIILTHTGGITTLYAHCEEILAQTGDTVTKGQVLATVGETGSATGPHLHFEIRNGETWLNPQDFCTFPKEAEGL